MIFSLKTLTLLSLSGLFSDAAYILRTNGSNSNRAHPPPAGGDQTNPPVYTAASDYDYQSFVGSNS